MKQLAFIKKSPSAFGGTLMKTRKGRAHPRPLAVRSTMHLVLRSTKARGAWSFRQGNNPQKIEKIVKKFAEKYSVRVHSLANVGNHLHFHLKLSNRQLYKPFIRALTGAIAMAVTGSSRWKKPLGSRFWDYRPFTRIISGLTAFLDMRDYMLINMLEGYGYARAEADYLIKCDSS